MSIKIRIIILFICIFLFFIITPYIVFYSLGYRIDFKNWKLIATGGIYVRTEQPETEVIIDKKISQKTGFFSNSVFVQNLLPEIHEVLVKKEGYFDYQKSILVQEKEVAKLENIILFKKNISFEKLAEKVDYFSVSPNGNKLFTASFGNKNSDVKIISASSKNIEAQFTTDFVKIVDLKWSKDSDKVLIKTENKHILINLSVSNFKPITLSFLADAKEVGFNPSNSEELFFIKNNDLQYYNMLNISNPTIAPTIFLKKVLAYKIEDNNIIWLGSDRNLNQSDIFGKNTEKITETPLSITEGLATGQNNSYKIFKNWQGIMVLQNNDLFLLNAETKNLENFHNQVADLKISPDNNNFFYSNSYEIWISHPNYSNYEYIEYADKKNQNQQKILLNKFSEKISDCFWLNNNYLIFKAGPKIKITEIDDRNNINIIDLPDSFLLKDGKLFSVKNPQIFFNRQDKKLYILTEENLIVSEKLLP